MHDDGSGTLDTRLRKFARSLGPSRPSAETRSQRGPAREWTAARELLVLTAKIAACEFAAEAVVMLLILPRLPSDLNILNQALLDAGSLTLITTPLIYFFITAPYIRMRDASERSQRMMAHAIEQSPIGVAITNATGEVGYANPRLAAISGRSLEETIGAPLRDVQGVSGANDAYDDAPLRNDDAWSDEVLRHRPDGSAFWSSEVVAPFHEPNGDRQGFIFIRSDVTEKKTNEADLMKSRARLEQRTERQRRTLKRLMKARNEAREANRAKSEFLAVMSHEIRTPMNGVLGMATALGRTELSAEQKAMLDVVQSSGRTLMTILDDILDISRVEAGRFELQFTPFDLRDVVTDIERLHAMVAEQKGVDLRVDLDDLQGDARMLGDPDRVRQVLHNIVSNAVKFTPSGQVTVRSARRRDAQGAERITIAVIDTGIGMTTEQLERVFQPFVQADSSIDREFGGSGLGLAIVKALVEAMGGSIEATSQVGAGSTFVVTLPFAPADAAPAPLVNETRRDRAPTGDAPPLRVLAVDDNPDNRKVLEALLNDENVELTCAVSGFEAVDVFRAQPFELVLMDIEMPGMNGEEALKRLRDIERDLKRDATPIVALTAHALTHYVQRFQAAGFDGVITKPIDAARLGRLVRERRLGGAQ